MNIAQPLMHFRRAIASRRYSIRPAESMLERHALGQLYKDCLRVEQPSEFQKLQAFSLGVNDRHAISMLAFDHSTQQIIAGYQVSTDTAPRMAKRLKAEGFFSFTGPKHQERLRVVEISQLCIHPDYRSGFFIQLLMDSLAEFLKDRSEDIVLGMYAVDASDGGLWARAVYEKLESAHVQAPASWGFTVEPIEALKESRYTKYFRPAVPTTLEVLVAQGAQLLCTPSHDVANREVLFLLGQQL